MVWWTKLNFLGLLPKSGNDRWDCEICNYTSLTTVKFVHFCLSICTVFEWVGHKIFDRCYVGCIVTKVCGSPRNLTCVWWWNLGTRLALSKGFLQAAATATMHCQPEWCTHPPPPVPSFLLGPIFKTDCTNWYYAAKIWRRQKASLVVKRLI